MARLNPFQRAREAIARTVERAVHTVEQTAQSAIQSVRNLGETLVSPFRNPESTEDLIQQRRDEELERIREQSRRQTERIAEIERFEEDQPLDDTLEKLTEVEKLWVSWGIDVSELDDVKDTHVKPLTAKQVGKLKKDEKLRKRAHPTAQSAIEYLTDIPTEYRRGVTKIGNFFYAIVEDSTKSKRKSRRKSGKMGKRNG